MRGSRAKELRSLTKTHAPHDATAPTRYMVKERVKVYEGPQTQADGTTKVVKVPVIKRTFLLAPTCIRYWQKKAKANFRRQALKGIHA